MKSIEIFIFGYFSPQTYQTGSSMIVREIRSDERDVYNRACSHPLQSWEWGEFRRSTNIEIIRLGLFEKDKLVSTFQISFHPVPKVLKTIGYIPKSEVPSPEVFAAIYEIAKQKKAIFIKLEPNWYIPTGDVSTKKEELQHFLFDQGCVFGKPLFTKYSFVLNLNQTEDAIMTEMKPKTRYNIGLAMRKGVTVTLDNSHTAFRKYLQLLFNETTKRQRFYAHDKEYHEKMWEILEPAKIAHLLKADYQGETLAIFIVFILNGVLYYPYGASSANNRDVMASNLLMWETIRFGKSRACKLFDMWGSLGPKANPKDPWYGFHHFKEGYGPKLMEFIGTFDLVIDRSAYQLYQFVDKLRWSYLKLRSSFPF